MKLYDKDFEKTTSFSVTLTEGDSPTIIDALDFAGWAQEQGYTEVLTPAMLPGGGLAVFIKPHPDYPAMTVQQWLRDLAADADEIIIRYLDKDGNFAASVLLTLSQAKAERQALKLTDEQKTAWLIRTYEID
jgi:imidazole glycerol phosphate synthase subunit HisF